MRPGGDMISKENELAQKIIEFYADKNLDCSVVSEKSSFLVILRSWDRKHEFKCKNKLPGKMRGWKALSELMALEYEKFQAQPTHADR